MKPIDFPLHTWFCRVYTFVIVSFAGGTFAADLTEYLGEPLAVGNGAARVMVTANTRNDPETIAVLISASALEGLPEANPGQEVWEYHLPMPGDGPQTGYDHVVLDWNPAGHAPEGVYSVPHFDVHFYLISSEQREVITFHGEGRDLAMKAPDQSLVPSGFVIPPDAAVEKMGMHGIDPAGPEFHEEPFTQTFIYGYYKGELMFVEPMVSLAFLQSLPETNTPVKRPQRYSYPAWYPSTYRIGFDHEKREYTIALTGMQKFDAADQPDETAME